MKVIKCLVLIQCSIQSLRLFKVLYTLLPGRLVLWKAFSHSAINAQRLHTHKSQPLFIAMSSILHLSKLEQRRVIKLVQGSTWQHMIQTRHLSNESPTFHPLCHRTPRDLSNSRTIIWQQLHDNNYMTTIWQQLHDNYMTTTTWQLYDINYKTTTTWQQLHDNNYKTTTTRQLHDNNYMTTTWQQLHDNYMTTTTRQQLQDNNYTTTSTWQQLHDNNYKTTTTWQQLQDNNYMKTNIHLTYLRICSWTLLFWRRGFNSMMGRTLLICKSGVAVKNLQLTIHDMTPQFYTSAFYHNSLTPAFYGKL